MNKFIMVHDANNSASPVIINVANICYIEKGEVLEGTSYIQLNDLDNGTPTLGFHVTETREQLFEMLK